MSRISHLICLFAVAAVGASAQCTINPSLDFLHNFNNSCYAVSFYENDGHGLSGDTNARYGKIYFKVNPQYELILMGAFRQARYFSVAVNDDHDALTNSLLDQAIQPLTSKYYNPYAPGASYQPDQPFAITISLGGSEPPPERIQAGCSLSAYNVQANTLPGNVRHSGINWNGDPTIPSFFPPHNGNPPVAGTVMIRTYLLSSPQVAPMKLLVRDLTTGCAVTADDALNTLQLITQDPNVGNDWMEKSQVRVHEYYATQVQPHLCYEVVSGNRLVWLRNVDYIPAINPYTSYVRAQTPSTFTSVFTAPSDYVLRLRLRVPVTANIPCAGCSLTGNEQLRYWSISFMSQSTTIASLSDQDVVKDANGYATIVVNIGGSQPINAITANGYTYVGLPSGTDLTAISMRAILASSNFDCSSDNVPILTSEDNPTGGFMGEYVPTADIVSSSQLPRIAKPFQKSNTCALRPVNSPENCTVFYPSN
jgi:hypothetical protein